MPDVFRVSATGAGVTYYPEFVARELGFFADENLDVVTDVPPNKDLVATNITADTADAALGGIWRPLMYRGRLKTFSVFLQVCDRFGGVVLGRPSDKPFTWTDLIGKLVLVPSGAPSPWLLLQGILRRVGVDAIQIKFLQDLTGAEMNALFRGGMGDYLLSAPPTSDVLVAEGTARVAAYFADAGEIPWSVYYSTPELLADPNGLDRAGRFSRAILRGIKWVLEHDPTDAPEVMERYFRGYSPDLIAASVRTCREKGVWTPTVHVNPKGLATWQEMLVEGYLYDAPVPYADFIDSRPATWAEQGVTV